MKKKTLSVAIAAMVLLSGAFVASCKKKSTTTTTPTPAADSDTQAAQDNNLAEQHSNDAFSMTGQASESGSVSYRLGAGGNSILGGATLTPMVAGATSYTINFGAAPGVLCNDGKTRSGMLLITCANPPFRNPGFTATITTTTVSPYIVDNYTVSINKTITNITATPITATSQMTWSVSATVNVTKPSGGGTISWVANRTHTLLNSQSTYTIGGTVEPACYTNAATPINWAKAVMQINGSTNGTSAAGVSYSATATNLIRNHDCAPDASKPAHHPFVQGTIDFTPSGKADRHIDFGNGNCDLLYTVTISGNTYGPYTLP